MRASVGHLLEKMEEWTWRLQGVQKEEWWLQKIEDSGPRPPGVSCGNGRIFLQLDTPQTPPA